MRNWLATFVCIFVAAVWNTNAHGADVQFADLVKSHPLYAFFADRNLATLPRPQIVTLPVARRNPGPQKDIPMREIDQDKTMRALLKRQSATVDRTRIAHVRFLDNSTQLCRLDFPKRCAAHVQKLAGLITEKLKKFGLAHVLYGPAGRTYFHISMIDGSNNFYFSNGIYAVVVDGDFNPLEFLVFKYPGNADIGTVHYAAVDPTDSLAHLVLIGGGKSLLKNAGFIVKRKGTSIEWISPVKTADQGFAIIGDRIYSSFGFTGVPDYIYELSIVDGTVTGRTKIDYAAHVIIADENRLYIEKYKGASVFELRR